jgi:serine/threonine protein kinase/tetratricopeptide (TPR) repeat protein
MSEPSLPEESIFAQALEITSAAERAAFLDRACGNNQALRMEVEALLRAHEQSGDLLDLPEKLPRTTAPPASEHPGVLLGPYKLLEQIGEGGMGSVWMAEQIEPIHRRVAVKVVKEGMDSRQVLARFEAERQALALMEHPNIARVLDAGQTPSGRPYFVMELVKGKPITKYCDEKRLAVRERLELFADVCRAVQHAHQKGIIHRDLKPSNVLVAPYDGRPVVKVIDFGVAKATGQRLTDKTLFTGFGALVGTPEYMSPEQAEVNNQDIDTRSDIYSLGVLLYELLTGSTPLTNKRLKEVALLEVLRVIREEEPPRPSTRLSESKDSLPSISAQRQTEPAKLTKLVRGELDWIAMKALEKDRNRRYETANGFAMDVQRYLADEPVLACPPSASYRLRKFLRRYKGPVLAASVIVFLLTAGIVGTSIGLVWALSAERKAVKERDDKEEARRQTRQALNTMTDKVIEELLGAQVQLTDKHRAFLKKVLEYHERFAAAKANDPEGRHSRAGGFFRVGRIHFFLGELNEVEAPYREALALRKHLADEFPDRLDYRHDLGESHRYLGMLHNSLQRTKEAEAEYNEAIRLGKQLVAESNQAQFREHLATWISNLAALLLLDAGRLEEAERLYRESLALSEELMGEFPEVPQYYHGVFADYSTLGMLLKDTNRPKEAEEICRKAVDLSRRLPAKFRDRPEFREELVGIHVSLGALLQSTGRPREALDAWREAVRLDKQLVKEFPVRPEFRAELAMSENNLGMLLHKAQRVAEAEKVWGEGLELFKQLAEEVPSRPDYRYGLAVAYHNMGSVFHGTKRLKEAEEAWSRAVEIGKELVHKHPDKAAYRGRLVLSYGHLALFRGESGRLTQAEEAWREILELTKGLTHDTDMAIIYHNFGQELESVRAPLDRILTVYRESLRLDNTIADTHFLLGLALNTAKQPDQAIQEYREALRLQQDFPEVHVNLGNMLMDRNELDDAITEYQQAIATKQKFPEVYKAHNGLGNAWKAKGQLKEAIAEYQTAIRLNKDFDKAHYGLGNAYFPHRLDEAIAEYRAAIRLNKNHAEAHTNLGNSLATKGDLDGAIHEYRTALGINKHLFEAHLNLGTALRLQNQLDEAISEYQEAIRLRKENASAHDHLGLAWQAKGRLPDALAEFREAIRLAKNNASAKEHLREAERLGQLQERLPAVLEGKDKPKDTEELLAFAQICQAPYRQQYAAAVRLYSAAFAAEPKLAEEPRIMHRYNAACAAALAGCGQGKDADKLDAKKRAGLRRQALDWLRADLEAWTRLLDQHQDMIRPLIVQQMRHWQADTDFAGVRGPEALAKLPEAERQSWQKLWDDIANTLSRVQAKTTPEKKSGAK